MLNRKLNIKAQKYLRAGYIVILFLFSVIAFLVLFSLLGQVTSANISQQVPPPPTPTYPSPPPIPSETVQFTEEPTEALLKGRIVGPDGLPLDVVPYSIGINLFGQTQFYSDFLNPGADGRFETNVPADTYQIEIWVDNPLYPTYFPPAFDLVQVTQSETLDLGDIRLRSVQLLGQLLDPNGAPVAAEFIVYSTPNADCAVEIDYIFYDSLFKYGYSDEQGNFSMGGLPISVYCLEFFTPWDGSGWVAPERLRLEITHPDTLIDVGILSLVVPPKCIEGI